jgi:hypothetical protein
MATRYVLVLSMAYITVSKSTFTDVYAMPQVLIKEA